MEIIGICGSPRGRESSTLRLMEEVLKGAEDKGVSTHVILLQDLDIRYCTGCGTCYTSGKCIHDDDFPDLFMTMLEADGIVLGSPVYMDSVTAQMKTMMDRMADAIHCQMFLGKYGCAVSTAGGSDAEEVADYMNQVLIKLGADTVGGLGVVLSSEPFAVETALPKAHALGTKLAEAIEEKKKFPVQEEMHREMKERMRNIILSNRDSWTHEFNYWEKRDWI